MPNATKKQTGSQNRSNRVIAARSKCSRLARWSACGFAGFEIFSVAGRTRRWQELGRFLAWTSGPSWRRDSWQPPPAYRFLAWTWRAFWAFLAEAFSQPRFLLLPEAGVEGT